MKKLILDTHTLLWYGLDDPRLSARARTEIEAPGNVKYVSPASLWEIAIKIGKKKYTLDVPYVDFFSGLISENGFRLLHIRLRHTDGLLGLPHHHGDPFDRLIIAQAIVDSASIVTADAVFSQYPVPVVW